MDTVWTVSEAAKILKCSNSTIYEMIASKQLPAVHIGISGRGVRIPVSSLYAWIEQRAQGGY